MNILSSIEFFIYSDDPIANRVSTFSFKMSYYYDF